MAQNQTDEDYDIPDPQDVLAGQQAQYNKEQDTGSGSQRALSNIRFGLTQAFGGGPQVQKAQDVKQRFQAIMQGVTDQENPDDDPLTQQMRMAHAISKGMIDIAPNVAMKANDQMVKLQQAKTQQTFLQAQTGHLQSETEKNEFQEGLNKKLGQIVFARQGDPDDKGLPTGLVSVGSLDPSDPDYAQKVADLQDQAKQQGQTIIPMRATDFLNSKDNAAVIRGQYNMATAQQNAAERLQAAVMKQSAAGGMDANGARQMGRILNGIAQGTASLQNITELPIGSSSGFLGVGSTPGTHLVQAGVDTLRNQLSSSDVQRYNVMVTGLANNLATIENFGLAPRGALTSGMERVIFREGDSADGVTALTKLAEAKQIIERGSKTVLGNPKLPDAWRDEITQSLADLNTAIPFTQHDVTALSKKEKGSRATIQDMITQRLGTEQKQTATPTPSGPSYTDADIAADMAAHGVSRETVLAAYARKGYVPAKAGQ